MIISVRWWYIINEQKGREEEDPATCNISPTTTSPTHFWPISEIEKFQLKNSITNSTDYTVYTIIILHCLNIGMYAYIYWRKVKTLLEWDDGLPSKNGLGEGLNGYSLDYYDYSFTHLSRKIVQL